MSSRKEQIYFYFLLSVFWGESIIFFLCSLNLRVIYQIRVIPVFHYLENFFTINP